MSGADDDAIAGLLILGGIVSATVMVILAPFALISNVMGTCTGYLASGAEGLYITGELGWWGLLFIGVVVIVLRIKMPYLWGSVDRRRGHRRGQTKVYMAFGLLVLIYIVAFWGLSQFTPPACATLPSEQFWPWLEGIIPW